jgi:hypothetical protein
MGEKRLGACRQARTTALMIPADWPSGVHRGWLTTQPAATDQPYRQNYVVFIVRDTRRAGPLLLCGDNT